MTYRDGTKTHIKSDAKPEKRLFDQSRRTLVSIFKIGLQRNGPGWITGWDAEKHEDISTVDPRIMRLFNAAERRAKRRRITYCKARYGCLAPEHERKLSLFIGK